MPVELTISSVELNRFYRDIDKYSKEVQDKCKKEVVRTVYSVHNRAVRNAPRKFSILITSIQPVIYGNNLTGEVKVGAKYGAYQEFGTGKRVRVPAGYEDLAWQFKGRGIREVNLDPHPYLIPAVENERQRFLDNIKIALNENS